MKNLIDYHDLYASSDTLLLAGFQEFQKYLLECMQFDPAHYYFASSLTWIAAFKKAKTELEFLADIK